MGIEKTAGVCWTMYNGIGASLEEGIPIAARVPEDATDADVSNGEQSNHVMSKGFRHIGARVTLLNAGVGYMVERKLPPLPPTSPLPEMTAKEICSYLSRREEQYLRHQQQCDYGTPPVFGTTPFVGGWGEPRDYPVLPDAPEVVPEVFSGDESDRDDDQSDGNSNDGSYSDDSGEVGDNAPLAAVAAPVATHNVYVDGYGTCRLPYDAGQMARDAKLKAHEKAIRRFENGLARPKDVVFYESDGSKATEEQETKRSRTGNLKCHMTPY